MKLQNNDQQNQGPIVQMAPLIDIVFLTLVFFMALSIYGQWETELNISVPKAEHSEEASRQPGEIIVNITEKGEYFVNQRQLEITELKTLFSDLAEFFPDQSVIIRADESVIHKHVVNVLDACANANIWNISFSTIQES